MFASYSGQGHSSLNNLLIELHNFILNNKDMSALDVSPFIVVFSESKNIYPNVSLNILRHMLNLHLFSLPRTQTLTARDCLDLILSKDTLQHDFFLSCSHVPSVAHTVNE